MCGEIGFDAIQAIMDRYRKYAFLIVTYLTYYI